MRLSPPAKLIRAGKFASAGDIIWKKESGSNFKQKKSNNDAQ
jgi:hypothetical protein